MITVEQIRQAVADYLMGRRSLDEFEDWFVAATWNIHRQQQQAAAQLAYAIELRLAEHSSGHLGEAELVSELAQLANPYAHLSAVQSGTSLVIEVPLQMLSFGTVRAAVC